MLVATSTRSHARRVTVLLVVGSLVVLLALACVWESRSGKPAWGSHLLDGQPPTTADAAKAGKRTVAASAALGLLIGLGGGDG